MLAAYASSLQTLMASLNLIIALSLYAVEVINTNDTREHVACQHPNSFLEDVFVARIIAHICASDRDYLKKRREKHENSPL